MVTDDNKGQDRLVTYALAQHLLGVGNTVMSRLIATGELPVTEHPFDKRQKLIRRSDIARIRESGFLADSSIHHTVTTWIIYALIDPRDETVHYVGRTIKAKRRLQQHLQEISNKKKSQWLKDLKKLGLAPRMEILETLECKAIDAERREAEWIQHLLSMGSPLTNIRNA